MLPEDNNSNSNDLENPSTSAQSDVNDASGQTIYSSTSENTPQTVQGQDVYSVQQNPANYQTNQDYIPQNQGKGNGFKKFLLIILIIALIGGGLFAALKIIKSGSNQTNEQVEITWWGLNKDLSLVEPVISAFENEHPNIKIKYVNQSPTDYRERLTNALAKGEGPDIFPFHNSWVSMFKSYLNPVPDTVISTAEFAETFYPVAVRDLTLRGNIVGLPLEYDGIVLFINEDIFANAAVSAPTTWDELREAARLLTQIDEQEAIIQSGVALGETSNVDHWEEIVAMMMVQNNANPAAPAEGVLAKDALLFYSLFSNEDKVWDETMPPSTSAFANGKVAMYFGPSWRIADIKEMNPSLRFRTIPVPQLPKESPSDPDVNYATYWAHGVWNESKNKEAAWEFMKYLISAEALETMNKTLASQQMIGKPYSRVDMREKLINDPYLGPLISQAPSAKSWYLASFTNDGETGINSQVSTLYQDAINSITDKSVEEEVLITLDQGIKEVLSQYGVTN